MYNYHHLSGTTKLALEVDEDTLKVIDFIQKNIQCNKMVAVTELLAKLAPILWGHFDREEVYPVNLNKKFMNS